MGGPIYDDDNFYRAAAKAITEILTQRVQAVPTEEAMRGAYDFARNTEGVSIRKHFADKFLRGPDDLEDFSAATRRHWLHSPESLYQDAYDFLHAIHPFVRIAVVANQESATREALIRDGLGEVIDAWGISADIGVEKPSPEFFYWALEAIGCGPDETMHIGNRYDNDVRPAKALGLRTAWLLRGEAPDHPPAEQLQEADWVIESLEGFDQTVRSIASTEPLR